MVKPVRVIILNGVGSVGKSSTARALQSIASASAPVLHVAGDAFLAMLPATMIGHPDGIMVERGAEPGDPLIAITLGAAVDKALRGMRAAVAALAGQGNDLIVDDMMLRATDQEDYRERLAEFELYFIGLFAPLAVLEEREKSRKDRLIGLARWQYDRVHQGIDYDLKIDTSNASPLACARKIAKATGI